MFIHSVYFWLKSDLTPQQVNAFHEGIASLTSIGSVKYAHTGPPAPTDRPIIDSTYSQALILVFDDQVGHDSYQDHEDHEAFRQTCDNFWHKIVIYDCVT